jgi:hypothetical protein
MYSVNYFIVWCMFVRYKIVNKLVYFFSKSRKLCQFISHNFLQEVTNYKPQNIDLTVRSYLFFSFGRFNLFLASLGIDIECMVHVALPKWLMNQFKPVQQSRQQALRAYCPNIYIYCEQHRKQHKQNKSAFILHLTIFFTSCLFSKIFYCQSLPTSNFLSF